MTSNDYRKELEDLHTQEKALRNRIVKRANDLIKKYPDVPIGKYTLKDYGTFEGYGVSDALYIIEVVEKYLVDQHPHKQTTIEFPDRDCISENSPDGKCHYKDDSKYCYYCGLNQNYF